MSENIILMSDSYKASHWRQYPPKTERVYSYFESRGGKFDYTVFFGLQYIVQKYLMDQVVTQEKIDEAKELFDAHMGPGLFNEAGWKYILEEHGGYLPLIIKAVPEGMKVPVKNVLLTIENTDPKCFWLTNYVETLISNLWYPTTVATQSRAIKEVILKYLEETGDPELIPFKLHDFGFRGVSSVESAGIGGLAHLVNFMGTDTIEAIVIAKKYYGAKEMPAFSIPAAEHSTITSWGRANEVKAFENMLDQFAGYPLVAVVSDSYDIFNACSQLWGKELKEKVLARNGTLVIRPDSGDPTEVVLGVLETLGRAFGHITNEKGYDLLPSQVRIIQGDGVRYETIVEILQKMKENGWSADNIAFGMGGGLLQDLNRDTQSFAFKCSSITIDGKTQDVWKDPVTDPDKKSKQGRMKLVKIDGGHGAVFGTVPEVNERPDILEVVFKNGKSTRFQTLDEIRGNMV